MMAEKIRKAQARRLRLHTKENKVSIPPIELKNAQQDLEFFKLSRMVKISSRALLNTGFSGLLKHLQNFNDRTKGLKKLNAIFGSS